MEQIVKIIKKALGNQVNPKPHDSIIGDLGADSLDFVEIIMGAEEAFKIEIPDEVAEKIRTVEDLTNICNDRKKVMHFTV